MRSTLIVCVLLGCSGSLFAQDPAAGAGGKKQDPEAVKLIERFDGLVYLPRASGLRDLAFSTKLPSGHNLVLRWKEPDKIAAELEVPADAPADRSRQLALVMPKFQEEARRPAPGFIDMEIGEVLKEKHKDDDVILLGPNQVRIVARSEASKNTFKEQTLTFNDQGLIKQTRVVSPKGVESSMEPTFTTWNGKKVYQTLKTKMTASQEESTVTFDYTVIENFLMIKKVVLGSKVGGKQREQVMEFFDFKVNAGIDDKVFEPKTAEAKPQ